MGSIPNFVAVTDSREESEFPWLKAAGENGVYGAKSLRATAEIAEKDLYHPGDGRPEVSLLGVVVNGFDGTGIGESE
jgi:hypothetical protein